MPDTFRTRVLGWISGCSTSGNSLSEGGFDKYYDILISYFHDLSDGVVYFLAALGKVGDGIGLIFNRRALGMGGHYVGTVCQ